MSATEIYPELVESTPHSISMILRLIIYSLKNPGVSSGLCSSGLSTKILYAFLFYPCVIHVCLILLHLITLIIFCEAYKLLTSSLRSLLQPAITFSVSGPNILLGTLFSDTLDLCSLAMTDHLRRFFIELQVRTAFGKLTVKKIENA
jgi:hypothetical protein